MVDIYMLLAQSHWAPYRVCAHLILSWAALLGFDCTYSEGA